jgi:hypothetical protein
MGLRESFARPFEYDFEVRLAGKGFAISLKNPHDPQGPFSVIPSATLSSSLTNHLTDRTT